MSLKPGVAGTLDELRLADKPWLPVVNHFVVPVDWSVLQPTPFGPIARPNPIDAAIAAARTARADSAGAPVGLKVRVAAGIHAPGWAKQLGGPPVQVSEPTTVTGRTGQVPRFWTEQFGRAWADLQRKLAAAYDGVPEVRETVISRCMTIFAEPMIRQTNSAESVRNLLAAGYTAAADDRCQREQISVARYWKRTYVSESFSAYQRIEPDGAVSKDVDYTLSMMALCRDVLGRQCVLENNELGKEYVADAGRVHADRIYARMRELGGPMCFQMRAEHKALDGSNTAYLEALARAVTLGATSVELNPTYRTRFRPTDLQAEDGRLTANARRVGASDA